MPAVQSKGVSFTWMHCTCARPYNLYSFTSILFFCPYPKGKGKNRKYAQSRGTTRKTYLLLSYCSYTRTEGTDSSSISKREKSVQRERHLYFI